MKTINEGLIQRRLLALAGLLAILVLAVAAGGCGSSDDSAEGTATAAESEPASTETTDAAAVEYDGPEADLPTTFPEPKPKDGFKFKVGYPSPARAVPSLKAQEDAVTEEVKRLGGEVIATDAQFSVQKQVSDFEQLLSQGVDAIILSALDPNSLAPLLDKAKSQDVPVFVNDVPYKAGEPEVPGFQASILSGSDKAAFARAKELAEIQPGAKYGLIGVQIPAPMLSYQVDQIKYWGDQLGIEFVERLDAKNDTPEDGAAAASALLAKHPDLDAVFPLGDSIALGTVTAARQAGLDDLKIISNNGTAPALEAIKNGDIYSTYFTDSRQLHRQLVWAAYNYLTDQNKNQPKQVVLGNGEIITEENVDSIEDPIG